MGNTVKAGSDGRARQLAALEPTKWKPGQSGNPKGAPKKRLMIEVLEDELERRAAAEGLPRREAGTLVARAWLDQVLDGSLGHLREFLDRRDGPVTTKVELSADVPKMLASLWAGVQADEPLDVLHESEPQDAIGSPVGEASDARLLTQGEALDASQGPAAQPGDAQPDPIAPDPS